MPPSKPRWQRRKLIVILPLPSTKISNDCLGPNDTNQSNDCLNKAGKQKLQRPRMTATHQQSSSTPEPKEVGYALRSHGNREHIFTQRDSNEVDFFALIKVSSGYWPRLPQGKTIDLSRLDMQLLGQDMTMTWTALTKVINDSMKKRFTSEQIEERVVELREKLSLRCESELSTSDHSRSNEDYDLGSPFFLRSIFPIISQVRNSDGSVSFESVQQSKDIPTRSSSTDTLALLFTVPNFNMDFPIQSLSPSNADSESQKSSSETLPVETSLDSCLPDAESAIYFFADSLPCIEENSAKQSLCKDKLRMKIILKWMRFYEWVPGTLTKPIKSQRDTLRTRLRLSQKCSKQLTQLLINRFWKFHGWGLIIRDETKKQYVYHPVTDRWLDHDWDGTVNRYTDASGSNPKSPKKHNAANPKGPSKSKRRRKDNMELEMLINNYYDDGLSPDFDAVESFEQASSLGLYFDHDTFPESNQNDGHSGILMGEEDEDLDVKDGLRSPIVAPLTFAPDVIDLTGSLESSGSATPDGSSTSINSSHIPSVPLRMDGPSSGAHASKFCGPDSSQLSRRLEEIAPGSVTTWGENSVTSHQSPYQAIPLISNDLGTLVEDEKACRAELEDLAQQVQTTQTILDQLYQEETAFKEEVTQYRNNLSSNPRLDIAISPLTPPSTSRETSAQQYEAACQKAKDKRWLASKQIEREELGRKIELHSEMSAKLNHSFKAKTLHLQRVQFEINEIKQRRVLEANFDAILDKVPRNRIRLKAISLTIPVLESLSSTAEDAWDGSTNF